MGRRKPARIGRLGVRTQYALGVSGHSTVNEDLLHAFKQILSNELSSLGYIQRQYDKAAVAYFRGETVIREEPLVVDSLKVELLVGYENNGLRVVMREGYPLDLYEVVLRVTKRLGLPLNESEAVKYHGRAKVYTYVSDTAIPSGSRE